MRYREALLALGAAVVALVLWDTFLLYPLKILVVLFHEISHGMAALGTGGSIERIGLTADQGGVCVTRGGSRFLVTSAGYLGSMAWGALLVVLGARTSADRQILGGLGIAVLAVTFLWVRTLFGFGYGVLMGMALVLGGWKLPQRAADVLLRAIGTTSCLYAVWDIGSDLLVRRVPGSDAWALAELTGLPSVMWGAVWGVLAVAGTAAALLGSVRGPSEPPPGAGLGQRKDVADAELHARQ